MTKKGDPPPEPAAAEEAEQLGEVVLCRFAGYPWWPCMRIPRERMPANAEGSRDARRVPVRFFGSEDHSYAFRTTLAPFDAAKKGQWHGKPGRLRDKDAVFYNLAWEQAGDAAVVARFRSWMAPAGGSSGDETAAPATPVPAAAPRRRSSSTSAAAAGARRKRKADVLARDESEEDELARERRELQAKRAQSEQRRREQLRQLAAVAAPLGGGESTLGAADADLAPAEQLLRLRYRLQRFLQGNAHGAEERRRVDRHLQAVEQFRLPMTPELLRSSKIGKVLKRLAAMAFDGDTHAISKRCRHLCRRFAVQAFPERFPAVKGD